MKRYTWLMAAVLGCATLTQVDARPIEGPGTSVKVVEARGSVTYYETFRGRETGIVSIVGDGSTDLDIFVYDSTGRLVGQGIGLTDIESVRFYTPMTETYRIVVRNLGNTWNRYTLLTD